MRKMSRYTKTELSSNTQSKTPFLNEGDDAILVIKIKETHTNIKP